MTIKLSRLGPFQISEETTDPGGEMFLEEPLLDSVGYRELTTGHSGHDLAKTGSVVLRLRLSFGAFDAVRAKILAQSSQRPFVEKPGEIV